MPNRSRKPKRDHDFATIAFRVVQEATSEEDTALAESLEPDLTPEERHAAAVALGRLGGKKGSRSRSGACSSS